MNFEIKVQYHHETLNLDTQIGTGSDLLPHTDPDLTITSGSVTLISTMMTLYDLKNTASIIYHM